MECWWSHGAVSVVNAIGTGGRGAAVAIDLPVKVCAFESSEVGGVSVTRGERLQLDPRIVEAALRVVERRLGCRIGAWFEVESWVPLEAGLKGSSALVNGLVGSAARLCGVVLDELQVALMGVEASAEAGLTITRALDDHLAVQLTGVVAADNVAQLPLLRLEVSKLHVAIVVPRERRSIRVVDRSSFEEAKPLYEAAWSLLVGGEPWRAATVNGIATAIATNVDPKPLLEAASLDGVVAAGISGKGPALYAAAETRRAAREAAQLLAKAAPSGVREVVLTATL